ncbi:response regulator transcription factor [Bacillaceae bacterium S4-13-58]
MKKILIIEDHIDIAELQRDYLEAEGYLVDLEDDGNKGLEKALHQSYDLLILDIMLPGQSGFDICRQLRKEKDLPILMISAKKEDVDKIRGLGLGADDYMVKPFSPSEMVARVKAHLSRYERLVGKNSPRSNEVKIGSLKIDLDDRRVFINEHEVIMTTKEFDLLLFFVKNPNHVFSKETLFEKIWGIDALGDISTVTVHIRRLRGKIEVDPSTPQFIETIWGIGYRFKI